MSWERFDSREEAEAHAKNLARRGETFSVEEHDEARQKCRYRSES